MESRLNNYFIHQGELNPEEKPGLTDATGSIELEIFRYSCGILLQKDGKFGWISGKQLEKEEKGDTSIEVEMQNSASLEGRVIDESGAPVSGVDLYLSRHGSTGWSGHGYIQRSSSSFGITTDNNGKFTLNNMIPTALEAGPDQPYGVSESIPGLPPGEISFRLLTLEITKISLPAGETVKIDIVTVPKSSVTVKGRFVLPDGRPLDTKSPFVKVKMAPVWNGFGSSGVKKQDLMKPVGKFQIRLPVQCEWKFEIPKYNFAGGDNMFFEFHRKTENSIWAISGCFGRISPEGIGQKRALKWQSWFWTKTESQ